MQTTRPREGEVWLVEFPFSDRNASKVRPGIVLQAHALGAECVYRTRQFCRVGSPTLIIIDQAESLAIGLDAAGAVDFSRRAKIGFNKFHKKLGDIGMPGDKLSVETWKRMAAAAQAAGM